MEAALEFFKAFFELFSVSETLRADAAERKVFGGTYVEVFAVSTGELFAASGAALKENHFGAQYGADCIYEFFDVVAVFYGEEHAFSVVIKTQIH